MLLLAPVKDSAKGIGTYLKGLSWLKSHPRYLFLLFLPVMLSITLLVFLWGVFWQYSDVVLEYILFTKPEDWWWLILYYISAAFLYLGVIVIGLVSYTLFFNVFASPLYEIVSVAVEKDLTGSVEGEISLWESLLLIKEELKKVFFILLGSTVILLIPGVNVIAPFVTAFFVGWDMYDYPLARRGWSFRKRLGFVGRHMWSVMGFGLWLIIPGGQMILMPLGIVGGSMLAIEHLKHDQKREET